MSSISLLGSGGYASAAQSLQTDISRNESTNAPASGGGNAAPAVRSDPAVAAADQVDATTTGNALSTDDLTTKISALITNEVKSGKLTSDQGAELQTLFSNSFAGETAADQQASDGADPATAAGQTAATGNDPATVSGDPVSASSGAASTGTSDDVSGVLNDFLKLLQDAQSSVSSYGASGSATAGAASDTSKLLNIRA